MITKMSEWSLLKPGMRVLPERFQQGPHSAALAAYILRRWNNYGYQRLKAIQYNPEWTPDCDKSERWRRVEYPHDGLRFIGKVYEIRCDGKGNLPYIDHSPVNHTGWFMDDYQEETAWGEVYQLPGRDGKPVFIPGLCTSNDDRNGNDGAVLDFHNTTDDLHSAIRWADAMAHQYAESEREYRRTENIKLRIDEIESEIQAQRHDLRLLAGSIREHRHELAEMGAVPVAVAERVKQYQEDIRSLRAKRKKLQEEL